MEIINTPETYAYVSQRVSEHVNVFIDGSFNNNLKEIKTPTHPVGFGWAICGANDSLDGFGVSGLMVTPTKSPERYELKGINHFLQTMVDYYPHLTNGFTAFTIFMDNANLVRFLSPEFIDEDYPVNDNISYAKNLEGVLEDDLVTFLEFRKRMPIVLRWMKGHRKDNVLNQIADGFAKRCYRSMTNGIHFSGKVRHSALRSVLYNNEMPLEGLSDSSGIEKDSIKNYFFHTNGNSSHGHKRIIKDRAIKTGGKVPVVLNVRNKDGQTFAVMSHQCSQGFKHNIEVYDYPVNNIVLQFQAVIYALGSYRVSPQFKHSAGVTLYTDMDEVSDIVNGFLLGKEPPIISEEGEDLSMWIQALRTASEGMIVRCHKSGPEEHIKKLQKQSERYIDDIFTNAELEEMLGQVG